MSKLINRISKKTSPVKLLSALAAVMAASQTPVVLAKESMTLEEIVVTVRRRVEMEQDVPISMTVMTEDYLRNQNITQVEDLGTKVPSMRITQAGGSLNEPVVTLRGQRQGEAAFNQDPAAPMYFNEIVIAPLQGSNMGIYDLQGLQVLKGPQGTLFGRNSTGGAIIMTPKRPGSELGGYAEVKVGDYNLAGFEGAIDVPLGDSIQTRLSLRKLDRDGFQKNIADNQLKGKDYRDEHSENVRLSVNFDLDTLSNLTVLAYDENKTAGTVPVTTGVNFSAGLGRAAAFVPSFAEWAAAVLENKERDNPWKVKTDINSQDNVLNVFGSNTTEFELNDELTVKNVLGYRKVKFANAPDVDGTAFPVFGAFPSAAATWSGGPAPATLNPRLSTVETEFYSDELQMLGLSFDDRLEWIVGLYWSKLTGTQDRSLQQAPGSYDSNLNDIENISTGIFAEGTYEFTDSWSLTAGLRQSWEDREITVRKWNDIERTACGLFAEGVVPNTDGPRGAPTNQIPAGSACERTVDESFSSPTWRLSLNYTLDDGGLIYGSASTGFRAGGFNVRGIDDATLQPFDEETVLTFEVGHKADWELGSVPIRSSLAVYTQTYEDIQNTVSNTEASGRLVTRTENAAEAEINGLELSLTVLPTDGLTLAFSYSYLDAQFKERDTLIAGVVVDTSGDDFTYMPDQTLTASATYLLPVDPRLGEISLLASVYWQDQMTGHPFADEFDLYGWAPDDVAFVKDFSEYDAYAVWNFRVDWREVMGSGFDLAVFMDNAFDEEYVLGGLNVLDSGGYGADNYGAPRTFGASLRYSF